MVYAPYNAPEGFDWALHLANWSLNGSTLELILRTAGEQQAVLSLSAVSPFIWRITMTIPGAQPQAPTPILVPQPPSSVTLEAIECADFLSVSGAKTTLRIDFDPFCLRFQDENGRDICRQNPQDIDGLGRPFILPLGFVNGDRNPLITETFHLRPDEHLFGLGEKFTPLDKRGQRIISWTQDAFGSTSERSHKNIPFLISTNGYGLLLDTGAKVIWELGTISCQSYTLNIEGTTLDAYWIYGPTPAEILARYTDLTGHAPMPPDWSFGLWMSGSGVRRDRASIENMVNGLESRDFPADVIHIDTWWMKWRQYVNYRFDAEAFPDVEQFIANLHSKGLKLSLWEQPYISIESHLYEPGAANGYFLKRPDGEVYVIDYGLSLAPRPDGVIRVASPETSWNAPVAIIDMSNPEAVRWFQDLHRPLLQMGVDVFKTDFGEDIPRDAVFSNGQTGAAMHNLYPLLYNQAVSDVTRQEKGYSLVWSRSGTAGNQRYPVCWSADPAADWDSLACTIRGGLSIGMSGIPFWSSDIGGYRGMPSPELFVRWAQFTLFCSHARMHGDSAREPWEFGDQAYAIVRAYVELRYRLFPYIYSAALEAAQTGMPVIRAMPLAFPDDPNTYDKDLQYMFGDSLLVAPIYNADGERSIYLPEGTWIDFHTGTAYQGPTNLRVHASLETMPIYVRGGSIIPTVESGKRIAQPASNILICDVYPHGSSSYQLRQIGGSIQFSVHKAGVTTVINWAAAAEQGLAFRFPLQSAVNVISASVHCESSMLQGAPAIIPQRSKQGSITLQWEE